MRYYEFTQSLTEAVGVKTLKIGDLSLDIDMDHLMNRMLTRAVGHHQVDRMLKSLPSLLSKIADIEPGNQFWIWNPDERVGLGFRKLNNNPKLVLKTAISSPPKGDRNPVITTESASGYIPSKKQANDPRFKTGLTKDVRPDSIQRNAKAFGFKTSRAGIPPLLRK